VATGPFWNVIPLLLFIVIAGVAVAFLTRMVVPLPFRVARLIIKSMRG